ncbi:MAG: tetratricopeptide repeat protein [Alphaproteobacteria bacterium]|nr:tetratricopeptide repeat protein [Alphaproteobacteria bacterium]
MLSLSSLILPALVALGVLTGIAVVDTQTVFLRTITIPGSMSGMGYTSAVVESRIAENLQRMEREARTRPETRRLALESEERPLELIADYLNLTTFVRAMQNTSGLIEFSVQANIVEDGDHYLMRLSIVHRGGSAATQSVRKPRADVEGLLRDTALMILLVVDPQVVCAGILRRYLESAVGAVDDVVDCIERTLTIARPNDRIWLHNLAGVAQFLKRDHAGAAEQFGRALRLDPDFSPALLNLGIMFALDGRHEEAIKFYRDVFPNPTIGESPQTYAAAYMEWGNSLIALGRGGEAEEKFAAAVRADPQFAATYFRWAETLPPGDRAEELRQLGRMAVRQNAQIYTENLVGVVRASQGRVAAASP